MAAITGPMATALAADRDHFNAVFHQARRASPNLDDGRFADALAELAQPVVEAAEAAAPGTAAAVTASAYAVMLDLATRGLTADAAVVRAWRDLLPALAGPVAADPVGVLAPLTNAVWNLTVSAGPRPDDWIRLMLAVGATPGLDAGALRAAGLVAAWRSGLAHARESALALAAELDPEVAAAALGIADPPKHLGPVIERLVADRWALPTTKARPRQLALVNRVGGFRGFGGPFVTTPRVATDGAGLLVRSGAGGAADDDFWDLHADRFGATLVRRSAPELEPVQPPDGTGLLVDGRVTLAGQSLTFAELAGPVSWAATTDTMVVTTARTYAVVVVAEAEIAA